LGKFTRVGARKSYPLMLLEAEQQVLERTVLLGNAAHTIHPNGAQGLNLCLRDVNALAACLVPALQDGIDPGDPGLLDKYLSDRLPDQRRIIRFSDGLASLFCDQQQLKVLARNSGMILMDLVPVLKQKLLAVTMGIGSNRSAIAR
jgi:2-octaprenyl-6-methoxyphenol hydroxylase